MSLRTDLIRILSRLSDDHAKTMDELEGYVIKFNGFKIAPLVQDASESRAYSLYCAGKHGIEIAVILCDEYPELDADQIDKIVNDAKDRFDEKDIPLENTTNE